jgi:hypothetical protein
MGTEISIAVISVKPASLNIFTASVVSTAAMVAIKAVAVAASVVAIT